MRDEGGIPHLNPSSWLFLAPPSGRGADRRRVWRRPYLRLSSRAREPPQSLIHLAASVGGPSFEGVILQHATETHASCLPPSVGLLGMSDLPQFAQEQHRDLRDGVRHYSCLSLLAFGGGRR